MRRTLLRFPLLLIVACAALMTGPAAQTDVGRTPARDRALSAIPHTTGTWDSDTLGNHRVVLDVPVAAEAVRALIPWRRRDEAPDRKNLIVIDAQTGARVANVLRVAITREMGDLVFQPTSGKGRYYVYYLPYLGSGRSNYPKVVYPEPEQTAKADWLTKYGSLAEPLPPPAHQPTIPSARVVEFQAIDQFDTFFPMEVIATAAELKGLLARHASSAYLVFPEDRRFPIRMTDDLPQRWIQAGANAPFRGSADRGEYYAFQVGVFAARAPIDRLDVQFGDLRTAAGDTVIPAAAFNCVNLGGRDWTGRRFVKTVSVQSGKVQPLWIGVQVPERAAPGDYHGFVTIAPNGLPPTRVDLTLTVSDRTIAASGDDQPWRHSRLRWLDSTLAQDDGIVAPYTPVIVRDTSVSILGRSIVLGRDGLPERIQSRFTQEMTSIGMTGRDVLAGPVRLVAEGAATTIPPWTTSGIRFLLRDTGAVRWQSDGTAGPLSIKTRATMEFDGNIEFEVDVRALQPASLADIRLEIPFARNVAKYMMGMGVKGGLRPSSFAWVWNVANNQDSAWIGDVNAGLQFTLKDDKYSRPLNTNFYHSKPLVMPASWANDGHGGCRMVEQGDTVLLQCFSGPRTMQRDEVQHYNFRLLLTPFHTLDTKAQFSTRYFHAFKPVAEAAATGANTLNIHHATDINPYLNYPFLRPAQMKAYIDEAHARGMKVKIYYTVRELSNHALELFALRSLGDEIFSKGPGGGYSWLQEHLGADYIAAWFVPELKDAAIINTGISRWHNYYIEGLAWLAKNVGIDGLYIDDVAFDRTTMKRVRKVLDRARPGALIDLHSANQYNVRDGFASSANLYLEHFPYLNRLWFGEYFDYNSAPDYWLVEISGIPFGLMGEMLQDNGNPWRGMVYGMTGRLPWAGDPRPLWKAWDGFGIVDSRMIGFWVDDRPVKVERPEVLATSYVRDGRTMVALASWAKEPVNVHLAIDWKALGLNPSTATLEAPAIENFQEARTFTVDQPIPVEPGKGWLIVIK
jgi:Glycoside hydrolase 123, N-terminal domain